MLVEGLSISIYMLLAILSGTISALGVWFRLRYKVDVQNIDINNHKVDILKTREELLLLTHVVEKNKDRSSDSMSTLKEEISQMEIRIIKEIHNLMNSK